jgi:HEAT repeat protein
MADKERDEKATGLSRLDTLRALRLWTVEASVATVQLTLTSGAFQTGFALYLGCNNFLIGVLAAIPSFAGLLQLVASYLAERYASRKFIVTVFALAGRLMWLPMLLIPFVLPKDLWVAAFLILTLLSSACGNIAAPSWMVWITDLVPADIRGRYFGQRNMYSGIVGMVVSVGAGIFLDRATKLSHWPERAAFGVIFGASLLFAFGSFICGRLSPDIVRTEPETKTSLRGALSLYAKPFTDAGFRGFIWFVATITVAQSIAGQFFTVYPLVSLHLSYSILQLLNAVALLTGLAAMPLWGYLADKYGNRPILILSLLLVFVPPVMWCVTWPDSFAGFYAYAPDGHLIVSQSKLVIALLNVFAGVGWAGVGLTQFNMMIGSAPRQMRPIYVAAVSAVVGVAGGVSPLIGGALLQALASVPFPAHGLVRSNYHALFMISAALRIAALIPLRNLHEAESRSTRYVLGQLRATKPIGSLAALAKLSRPTDSRSRGKAAAQLGRLKTPVAVEELVRALDDVALPVREKAAEALGEIGDARAVGPLVTKLTDPASGIATAAATALGRIGDKSALPALAAAAQLEGPRTRRLAALEALGSLSDTRAASVLLPFVESEDPAERMAAIRSLSGRDDLVRQPIVARALLALWERESDPATQTSLADALGRAGDPALAPRLLGSYDRIASPIARREVLNAVGSLLAGRDSFYVYLVLDGFARDETVTKILTSLQRQFTAREPSGSPRMAVRVRQALEAYARADYTLCAERLGLAARLLSLGEELKEGNEVERACVEVMGILAGRAHLGRSASPEEVLLMVFLLRFLVVR